MFSIAKQRNLLHWFKHKSIGAEKLNKYLELFPETNRNVGTLPYDWLKPFEPSNRASVTRQVQDSFTSFSKETAHVAGKSPSRGWRLVNPDDFKEAQKVLVEKLKKILNREDIKIAHAGTGALKNCHRLDVGEYSYALSGFRAPSVAKKGFGNYFTKAHGRGNEPSNFITAYNKGAHGRFVKPFTVKISDTKDKGGYVLSKFVDKQKKAPIGEMQESRGYFLNLDRSEDTINNINTDIGGCIANARHIKNKNVKNSWNYFARMFDINSARLKTPKAQMVQKRLLEDKLKGENILAAEYINQSGLKGEDKDIAVKLLRSLRKVRVQKEKLIKKGKFEEVKKLINEDISFIYSGKKNVINEITDFVQKFETYPRLIADEMEIPAVLLLENWTNLYQKYGTACEVKLNNCFAKKDVIKLLNKKYVNLRNNDALIEKLRSDFKLNKEISALEKKYKQSALGKSEVSWDAFEEFMNRGKQA